MEEALGHWYVCFGLVLHTKYELVIDVVVPKMKATRNNAIEDRFTVVIIREVLIALSFLHKSAVIHRDIKGWCSAELLHVRFTSLNLYCSSCEHPRHAHRPGRTM